MYKVLVVGAGRVGSVIARDLSDDPHIDVTLADANDGRLEMLRQKMVFTPLVADLSDPAVLGRASASADLVVGALPGPLGRRALEGVVDAGKRCVDISFMAEDPRSLDERAKQTGSVVVYDFGVAPGMSNLLAAFEARRLAPAEDIQICVGGLPRIRREPWSYAAPFSPTDVIEEYVRPVRIRVEGKEVVRPPLSDLTHVDVPGIGTLEAFLSDGLRSLVDTVDCPNMTEKTMRYPGHRDKVKVLLDSGFFSTEPVDVSGEKVAPRDVALAVLENAWREDDGGEFTVMEIKVKGRKGTGVWRLVDATDDIRRESSMARTTGFPVAILVRKMLAGEVSLSPGVHPPEALAGEERFVMALLSDLGDRNVVYRRTGVSGLSG